MWNNLQIFDIIISSIYVKTIELEILHNYNYVNLHIVTWIYILQYKDYRK